ncbi:MAG: HEPN domain-containing protein [Planctomycetes bacterium]|nr:HEPN domain-containing protein [Planctomycetota bacterium]
MDPWHFLIVAEQLRDSDLEAGRRSSISRSYYAAYNEIVASLRERGVTLPERDAHEKLCRCLIGTGHHALVLLAEHLRWLRIARTAADYDMEAEADEFSVVETANALSRARKIRQQFVGVGADRAAELVADYLRRTRQTP